MINRILTFSLIVQIALAGAAFPAETRTLTLDECIETAMNEHPDLQAAAGRINSTRAQVGQAAAENRVQVSAGTGYTRSDNSVVKDDSGSYSSSVKVSQPLFDWGRNNLKIEGAKTELDATTADYLAVRDTVISNVRSSYYALNRSLRQLAVARTRFDNYKQRLDWANSFYEVGTKARIEVTKAEADLANSRLTLVQSESAVEQSRSELASAMGLPMLNVGDVADVLEFADWSITVDEAAELAVENRPGLLAQKRRVNYAQTNLALQMKGKSPTITASGGYNFYGSAPFDENGWDAGVSLSVPIFDGGLTKSKIEGAQADLMSAEAQYDSLFNSVILEVRKAWESMREARQSLDASMESERYAKETLELAQGRYKAGVGDSLEISDAVDAYASAQTNTVLTLYNCKYAQLNLEKAIGGL